MIKDLLIGNTTQLSYYWDKYCDNNTKIISSRNIDLSYIKSQKWNRIYIAFAEGRTFLKDAPFYDVNVTYTLNLINEIKDYCKNIIYYSTTELWNKCNGPINIETVFNYDITSTYIYSKSKVTRELLYNDKYKNVIILYPFSFNSPHRKESNFLFSKVFDSIINKKRIILGNIDYYRELLHPKFVIEQSNKATTHQIIGSGRVVYVKDFIKDLYDYSFKDYDQYIEEDKNNIYKGKQNIFYLDSSECLYSYEDLLLDTINDIFDIEFENEYGVDRR
jgi:nucleoside-diphosphate-sugar epimerase